MKGGGRWFRHTRRGPRCNWDRQTDVRQVPAHDVRCRSIACPIIFSYVSEATARTLWLLFRPVTCTLQSSIYYVYTVHNWWLIEKSIFIELANTISHHTCTNVCDRSPCFTYGDICTMRMVFYIHKNSKKKARSPNLVLTLTDLQKSSLYINTISWCSFQQLSNCIFTIFFYQLASLVE